MATLSLALTAWVLLQISTITSPLPYYCNSDELANAEKYENLMDDLQDDYPGTTTGRSSEDDPFYDPGGFGPMTEDYADMMPTLMSLPDGTIKFFDSEELLPTSHQLLDWDYPERDHVDVEKILKPDVLRLPEDDYYVDSRVWKSSEPVVEGAPYSYNYYDPPPNPIPNYGSYGPSANHSNLPYQLYPGAVQGPPDLNDLIPTIEDILKNRPWGEDLLPSGGDYDYGGGNDYLSPLPAGFPMPHENLPHTLDYSHNPPYFEPPGRVPESGPGMTAPHYICIDARALNLPVKDFHKRYREKRVYEDIPSVYLKFKRF